MVADQEVARAFVEEALHGAMEVGLIVKARLVRHVGQSGGVVEIEQAHDPVDLQDLSEELRVDADDVIEVAIEMAWIGVQLAADVCDANGAVGALEERNRLLDESI